MLYLLDANTIIDAKRDYYPIHGVPEFWDWLIHHGEQGNVKIPFETYSEFLEARNGGEQDELSEWADQPFVKEALLLDEIPDQNYLNTVIYQGYMPTPSDEDIGKMGQDPFLISYALVNIDNRCIVTSERSKPKSTGANKKIPDVCTTLNVHCIHGFDFFRRLHFSTGFRANLQQP